MRCKFARSCTCCMSDLVQGMRKQAYFTLPWKFLSCRAQVCACKAEPQKHSPLNMHHYRWPESHGLRARRADDSWGFVLRCKMRRIMGSGLFYTTLSFRELQKIKEACRFTAQACITCQGSVWFVRFCYDYLGSDPTLHETITVWFHFLHRSGLFLKTDQLPQRAWTISTPT